MSEPRKGPEIEMRLPKTDSAQAFDRPARRQPTIVEGDITPAMTRRMARTTIVALLRGGPCDGIEVDVPAMAMEHKAEVERDFTNVPPFEFDADVHALFVRSGGKEGRPNIVVGDQDTVTYKRTNEKTADGAVVFVAA